MKAPPRFVSLALGVFALAACTGPDESTKSSAVASPTEHAPQSYLVPGHTALGASSAGSAAPRATPPAEDDAPQGGELLWKKPDAWEEVPSPSGGMIARLATYRVPHDKKDDKGKDAEMTVTRAGGDVDSNVQRWVGQFEEKPTADVKTIEGPGFKVTRVAITGTFGGGMAPGGEKTAGQPDQTLLAAIVDTGGDLYFFKLLGPKATVEAASKDFEALLGSFRVTTP